MDYMDLLRLHDDRVHWESPLDFDNRVESARFDGFVKDLSTELGTIYLAETGSAIQDASFHSQIVLQMAEGRFVTIRFSNFGNMATVSDEDLMPEPMMRTVQDLFLRHGYVYVPATVLNAPYTGSNPGVTGIETWRTRYFDWV